jgi:hypothetical protein
MTLMTMTRTRKKTRTRTRTRVLMVARKRPHQAPIPKATTLPLASPRRQTVLKRARNGPAPLACPRSNLAEASQLARRGSRRPEPGPTPRSRQAVPRHQCLALRKPLEVPLVTAKPRPARCRMVVARGRSSWSVLVPRGLRLAPGPVVPSRQVRWSFCHSLTLPVL